MKLPTKGLRVGNRVRVLGFMERPVPWTDLFGHTVSYAFVKAVFADKLR